MVRVIARLKKKAWREKKRKVAMDVSVGWWLRVGERGIPGWVVLEGGDGFMVA